jgi:electron transfer flavoprotein alpha subunit
MQGDILVLVEHTGAEIDPLALQLLAKGRELADMAGCRLGALLLGDTLEKPARSLREVGPDIIFVAQSSSLRLYNPELYTNVIADVVEASQPSLILIGYTLKGMEIGPALATRIGARLFSNCVALEWSPDGLLVTRPMYGGMVYTQPEAVPQGPLLVSVQSGVLPHREVLGRSAEVVPVAVRAPKAELRTRALEILDESTGGVDLRKAEVIVAAGRGIGDKSNLRLVEALAEALGGALACSRPLVDCGWLHGKMQVGLSGHTVRPKVYIACGISGAPQHVAGMRDAQLIIAINTDPKAPIFRVAHCGIIGNLLEVVPALTERAQQLNLKRG